MTPTSGSRVSSSPLERFSNPSRLGYISYVFHVAFCGSKAYDKYVEYPFTTDMDYASVMS